MSSKYLSIGTAVWTASTGTISGASVSPGFEADDAVYMRQIIFRIGANVYYGRVSSVSSSTSVVLLKGGLLPSSDGTIAELFLLDLSEKHSYQSYVGKIKAMVKDEAEKLSQADIDKMIAQAVSDFSRDVPFYVKKKVPGAGISDYNLMDVFGSLWITGYSYIREIEYPFGEKPEQFLEQDEWSLYDDGTEQDGSNLVLRFQEHTPASGESFVVELRTEMNLPPAGVQNFPDTDENFTNITLLASAYCCQVLAAAYAQSSDSTISADVVNYHDKTRKYSELAGLYLRRYNRNVLGSEEPLATIPAVMIDRDVRFDSMADKGFLFHSHY